MLWGRVEREGGILGVVRRRSGEREGGYWVLWGERGEYWAFLEERGEWEGKEERKVHGRVWGKGMESEIGEGGGGERGVGWRERSG